MHSHGVGVLLLKGIIRTLGETCVRSCSEGYYFCSFFFFFCKCEIVLKFKKKERKMEKRGKKRIGITCAKYR